MNCVTDQLFSKFCRTQYGLPIAIAFSNKRLSILDADITDADAFETLLNAQPSERLTIIKGFGLVTPAEAEKIKFTGSFADYDVRTKGTEQTFEIFDAPDEICNIFYNTLNNQEKYIWMFTERNFLAGLKDGSLSTKMFLALFKVLSVESTGEKSNHVKFMITPLEESERQSAGKHVNAETNNLRDLENIQGVLLTVGAKTATTVTVTLTEEHTKSMVTGEVATDWDVRLASDKSAVVVTSTPDSVYPNIYTIGGLTTATAYEITLKPQPSATTKGYNAINTLLVTTT